eukprot:COSAG02_NODE_606_length_19624_cov_33.479846_9_plen_285_part_00
MSGDAGQAVTGKYSSGTVGGSESATHQLGAGLSGVNIGINAGHHVEAADPREGPAEEYSPVRLCLVLRAVNPNAFRARSDATWRRSRRWAGCGRGSWAWRGSRAWRRRGPALPLLPLPLDAARVTVVARIPAPAVWRRHRIVGPLPDRTSGIAAAVALALVRALRRAVAVQVVVLRVRVDLVREGALRRGPLRRPHQHQQHRADDPPTHISAGWSDPPKPRIAHARHEQVGRVAICVVTRHSHRRRTTGRAILSTELPTLPALCPGGRGLEQNGAVFQCRLHRN